jgi:Uma2 family endonuclease
MTLTTSPAPSSAAPGAAFDALGALRLPHELRLTPEQFALVCAENLEAVLDLVADGRVIAMTSTGSETGPRISRLEMRLQLWDYQQAGWKVCGSSSGFRLPGGSVLNPDASLIRLDRLQSLTVDERRRFVPLCPQG